MQNAFSCIPKKRFQRDVQNCGKGFKDFYSRKRRKDTHQPKHQEFVPALKMSFTLCDFNSSNLKVAESELLEAEVMDNIYLDNMIFFENNDAEEENEHTEETNVDNTEEVTKVEDQSSIIVNGEFFSFRDKLHLLFHQFYYRSGGDISQSMMKDVVNLLNDVVQAKQEYPEANVPAADLIFNYDDVRRTKNQIPVFKQQTHQVTIQKEDRAGSEVFETKSFSMNAPSDILRFLVANPSTSNKLCKLPDETTDQMIESYQSAKWRTHHMFQHPMITLTTNGVEKDVWIGDFVETNQFLLVAERFFHRCSPVHTFYC